MACRVSKTRDTKSSEWYTHVHNSCNESVSNLIHEVLTDCQVNEKNSRVFCGPWGKICFTVVTQVIENGRHTIEVAPVRRMLHFNVTVISVT